MWVRWGRKAKKKNRQARKDGPGTQPSCAIHIPATVSSPPAQAFSNAKHHLAGSSRPAAPRGARGRPCSPPCTMSPTAVPAPCGGCLQPFPFPALGVTKTYQFSSVSKLSRGSRGSMKGRLSGAIWFISGCFSTEGEGLRQVPGICAKLAACGCRAGGTQQAGSDIKGIPGSRLFPLFGKWG